MQNSVSTCTATNLHCSLRSDLSINAPEELNVALGHELHGSIEVTPDAGSRAECRQFTVKLLPPLDPGCPHLASARRGAVARRLSPDCIDLRPTRAPARQLGAFAEVGVRSTLAWVRGPLAATVVAQLVGCKPVTVRQRTAHGKQESDDSAAAAQEGAQRPKGEREQQRQAKPLAAHRQRAGGRPSTEMPAIATWGGRPSAPSFRVWLTHCVHSGQHPIKSFAGTTSPEQLTHENRARSCGW